MAVDGSVLIDTKIDDSQYRKALADMKNAANSWAKGTAADFDAVSKSSANLAGAIKAGVAAFAGFKTVGAGKDALMSAARYETLGITLETVGRNVGKTAAEMKGYEDGLKRTGIAALEARSSVIQLATANLNLEKSSELARVAQDLAVVSGLSSAESFERMTQGIIGGQPLILRAIGLNVSFEQSYIDLAATLGKNADKLTEQEKVQARMNIVLKEGANFAGVYESAMETSGKQIASMARYLSDLSVKVGGVGLDALALGVQDVTKGLKGANEQMDAWAKSGALDEVRKGLGEGFRTVASYIDVAAVALTSYVAAQKIANTETFKSAKATVAQTAALSEQAGVWGAVKAQITGTTELIGKDTAAYVAHQKAVIADTQATIANLEVQIARKQGIVTESKEEALKGSIEAYKNAKTYEAEVTILKEQHAVATARLTAAQNSYTVSTTKASVASSLMGKAFSGIKGIFSGIITMLGGPWLAGLTAAATGVYLLVNRQTEAEKTAKRYGFTLSELTAELDALKNGTDEASDSVEALNEKQRGMRESALLKRIQAETEAAENAKTKISELKNVTTGLLDYAYEMQTVSLFPGIDPKFTAEFTNIIKLLQDGDITARDAKLSLEVLRDEIKKIADSSRYFSAAGVSSREFGQRILDVLSNIKGLEQSEKTLNGLKTQFEALAKFGNGLTTSTEDLSAAFKKLDTTPKTFEESVKFLQNLTKETALGKKETIEKAKADADAAMALLRNAAAAQLAAASTAELAAVQAMARGETSKAGEDFATAAKHMESYAQALGIIAGFETKLKGFDFSKIVSTKGEGKPAAETIREIRKEIDQLTRTSPETVAEKLAKGLADIAEKGRKAHLPLKDVIQLQEELHTKMGALQEISERDFLREFNAELAQMSGKMEEVKRLDLEGKLIGLENKMRALGKTTEEVSDAQAKFTEAYKEQVQINNLQEAIGFLKELEQLSGMYGVSIEKQNELISLQAEKFRAAFPELESLVDEWEKFKKLEIDPSWEAGIERSARKFVAEWSNAGKVAEKQFDIMIGAVQALGDGVIDAIFDGAEFRADQFLKNLAKQIMQMMMNQMISRAIGEFFPTAHTGSIIGVADSNPSKKLSIASQTYIPKYHSGGIVGLDSTERLTITQVGEGVFTPAQMARLAPVSSTGVVINVHNTISDQAQVEVKETRTANGAMNIEMYVRSITNKNIAAGAHDAALSARQPKNVFRRG